MEIDSDQAGKMMVQEVVKIFGSNYPKIELLAKNFVGSLGVPFTSSHECLP